MDLYSRVIGFVREQPWAILPGHLSILTDMMRFRAQGGRLTQEEIRARIGADVKAAQPRERKYDPETDETYFEQYDRETGQSLGFRSQSGAPVRSKGGLVSIIAVRGIISQRAAMMDDMSGPGGTSTEGLARSFRTAMNDPAIASVLFDIDSPGGGVYGVQELGEEIRASRGAKPIRAVANSLAASAAYWIMAQAEDLAITPSGEAGSIGVYSAHEDLSKALELEGVKVTLISHGKNKTSGNPFEPLSEEALLDIQSRVDDYGRAFETAVAKGRGVPVSRVQKDFGQGKVFGAKEAVEIGLVDRVATLDEVVRKMSGQKAPSPSAAELTPEYIAAEHEAARVKASLL